MIPYPDPKAPEGDLQDYGRGPGAEATRWGAIGTAAVLGGPLAMKGLWYTGKGLVGGLKLTADASMGAYASGGKWVAEKATGFKEGLMDRYNRMTNPFYGKEHTPGGHVPSEQNIANQQKPKVTNTTKPSTQSTGPRGRYSRMQWNQRQLQTLAHSVARQKKAAEAAGMSLSQWRRTQLGKQVMAVGKKVGSGFSKYAASSQLGMLDLLMIPKSHLEAAVPGLGKKQDGIFY